MTEHPQHFLFHDYESFGANPRWDRPAQFGAIRCDADLNEIDAPVRLYCKPTRDVLPQPEACLITGITPQIAEAEGVPEPEFFAVIHDLMRVPGTCALGYNSLRFDDELTRHGLWRNFFPPYDREWREGNSRFDLLDPMRLCYAVRPEGLNWPRREDGAPSFRLEHLSQANGIEHGDAHDALADVRATMALARLLRRAQPKLWDFLIENRDKRSARHWLDLSKPRPVLHSSMRFAAERGGTALVFPLAQHPHSTQGIIVFDLMADPAPLFELEVDELRDRVFVARADLPDDIERVPLKTVHLNRCPTLAPASVLQATDPARIGLDLQRCQAHAERLQAERGLLAAKIALVFETPREFAAADAETDLYSGLPPDADLAQLSRLRAAAPEELASWQSRFRDPRYQELLLRRRARWFPHTLNADESERFRTWVRGRLFEGRAREEDTIAAHRARIRQLRGERPESLVLLDALESWLDGVAAEFA